MWVGCRGILGGSRGPFECIYGLLHFYISDKTYPRIWAILLLVSAGVWAIVSILVCVFLFTNRYDTCRAAREGLPMATRTTSMEPMIVVVDEGTTSQRVTTTTSPPDGSPPNIMDNIEPMEREMT